MFRGYFFPTFSYHFTFAVAVPMQTISTRLSAFRSAAAQPAPAIPPVLDETYPDETSTQEAFGRVLGALGRQPTGDALVTVSADVAITTPEEFGRFLDAEHVRWSSAVKAANIKIE